MELIYVVIQDRNKDMVAFIGTLIECGEYLQANPQCRLIVLTVKQWQESN